MFATTAAFLGSGPESATVAPPTTVNRACELVSELAQIADAGADDHGICNGPKAVVNVSAIVALERTRSHR
jgi:hypothetical protein